MDRWGTVGGEEVSSWVVSGIGGRWTGGVWCVYISPVREGTLLRELHGVFGVGYDPRAYNNSSDRATQVPL